MRQPAASARVGRGQRAIVCAGDTRHFLVRVETCALPQRTIARSVPLHRGIVDRRHGISVPAAARGARAVPTVPLTASGSAPPGERNRSARARSSPAAAFAPGWPLPAPRGPVPDEPATAFPPRWRASKCDMFLRVQAIAGAESDGPFCGDSISFAHDDDARRQPFVAGLEGFQPPRDADRAGGHAVVVGDGREAR